MPFDVSLPELLIILVAALLVFGPKRLPEMGRSLGKGMREFRNSVSGIGEADDTAASPPITTSSEFASAPAEARSTAEAEQAPPDPAEVRAALESLSDEDRRAIMESLAFDPSEAPSAPEASTEISNSG